jgi:Mitochondrial carrier protein
MKDVFNGAIAGGIEVLINNPLVVIKNDLILNKKESNKHLQKNPQNIIKKYYKGCGAGIASMAPITALQNSTAFLLAKIFGNNPTLTQKTIAAYEAGWLSALLASPADLIVLQRQSQLYSQESLRDTLQRIYKVNGLAAFYRGLNGTGIRDGIFTAAYKTGGNIIHNIVPTITGNTATDKILCASLAGLIAAIISHPADVVTARMKSDLSASYYKTTLQTTTTIVTKEGFAALFKGLTPRAFRIIFSIPLLNIMLDYEVGTTIIKKIGC